MSISSRITEMTTHLENNWRSIEALTGTATVDKNIENIASVLDNLYETLPKSTGTGESLSLSTLPGKLKIDLLGNTSQTGTPTPSTPIPVNVVSGDNEVVVCGKNLIGLDTQQYKVDFKAGDKITISNTTSLSQELWCYTNYGDSTRNDYWSVASNQTRTITLAYDTGAIRWGSAISGGFAWVNNGESASAYEPYKQNAALLTLGDKEVCKIGNYEDKIFKAIKGNEIYDSLSVEEKNTLDYGKWYLRKAIKKIIANGTETFNLSTDYINAGRFNIQNYTDCIYGNLSQPGSISSHFKSVFATANGNIYNSGIAREICMINTDFAGNLNGFKSWLETNQPIIYYILATPTNELFNDAQQEQLEDIYNNMISYEGQTNINQISNDKPFKITATALLKVSGE